MGEGRQIHLSVMNNHQLRISPGLTMAYMTQISMKLLQTVWVGFQERRLAIGRRPAFQVQAKQRPPERSR